MAQTRMTTQPHPVTSELLNCPFCGSVSKECRDSGNEVWGQKFWIECPARGCNAKSPKYDGSNIWHVVKKDDDAARAKAIAWWNRRP